MDIITKLQIAAILVGVITFSTCLEKNPQKESFDGYNITINPQQPFENDSITFVVKFDRNKDFRKLILFYKTSEGVIDSSAMNNSSIINIYSTTILPVKEETFISYYIVVETNSGNKHYIPTGAPLTPAGIFVKKE